MKTLANTLKSARSRLTEHMADTVPRSHFNKTDDSRLLPLIRVLHCRPDAKAVLAQHAPNGCANAMILRLRAHGNISLPLQRRRPQERMPSTRPSSDMSRGLQCSR